jgi:hypothetical protein
VAPLVLDPFRFLAIMAMIFGAIGAGWVILAGWILYSFAAWYGEDRLLPAGFALLGVAGFVAAVLAIYGLVVDSWQPTVIGVGTHLIAASIAFFGSLGYVNSGPGVGTFMAFALLVALTDAGVIAWACLLRRSSWAESP